MGGGGAGGRGRRKFILGGGLRAREREGEERDRFQSGGLRGYRER